MKINVLSNRSLTLSSSGFWDNILVKVGVWLFHDTVLRKIEEFTVDLLEDLTNQINEKIGHNSHRRFTFINRMNPNRLLLTPLKFDDVDTKNLLRYRPYSKIIDDDEDDPSSDPVNRVNF